MALNLLFDRNLSLASPEDLDRLSDLLADEYVADVQPVENLAAATYTALDRLRATQRSNLWKGRSAVIDKWHVAGVLRDAGLSVPDTLAADSVATRDAIAQLSLPIVLKRRVSAAGTDVQVAHSLQELDQLMATIDDLDDWFFERFIEGRSIVCAHFVDEHGGDLVAMYEITKRSTPLGPPSGVTFLSDPQLVATARRLTDALGIRGFANFDLIRDDNGRDWIHDINPRVIAGIALCQFVGFDFLGSYVRCLSGQGPTENEQLDASGAVAYLFPGGWKDVLRSGGRRGARLRVLRWVGRYWKLLGPRYFLFVATRRADAAGRRLRQRLGFRRERRAG